MVKLIYKLPKGEELEVTCKAEGGKPEYLHVSKQLRTKWFLYYIDGDKLIKIHTANSPVDFEKHRLKHIKERTR